jgi:hypothetical protein
MIGCESCLLAASTVLSAFGLIYLAMPLTVLLVAARLVSWRSRGWFGPLVCGGVTAIAAVTVVAYVSGRSPNDLLDRNLALAVNAAACVGAAFGVGVCAGLRAAAYGFAGRRSRIDNTGAAP